MLRSLKLVAVALLVAAAARAEDKKPPAPLDDATFVKMAASDGLHEVELGKIGSEKAKSAEVKKFAEMMVKDHSKANDELKAAAKAAGVEVPAKMTEKHQKAVEMFKNYKGADFDAAFMKHMAAGHQEAADLFTRATTDVKNKELNAFAAKTLPTIKEHLETAKKLSGK